MIISLCIPCMNRTYNLKQTLPSIIKSANASPPVEITILNYSSTDDLESYLEEINKTEKLVNGNTFNFIKLFDRKYYHSAHARNLTVLASEGEYIIQLDTEAIPSEKFIKYIRERLELEKFVWMCEGRIGRYVVIKRQEFIDTGGYDERFNVYSPEDKDLCLRMHRRGGKFEVFPPNFLSEIPTSNKEKLENLDQEPHKNKGIWIKRAMFRAMKPYYEENIANGVLVVNKEGWGKWK